MNKLAIVASVATIVAASGTATAGITGNARQASSETPSLVLVGPVEAINASKGFAVILGQKVFTAGVGNLSVGETVSVIGTVRSDGSVLVAAIEDNGLYVAGASNVLLTGTVEKVDESRGRAVVSGVSVDLTPLMGNGPVSLTAGSKVELAGTQPVGGGLILVSGITGNAVTQGITGNAVTQGITGNAVTQGITGNAVTQGITGNAVTQGITGNAVTQGITGNAVTQGITGNAVTQGITGNAVTQGITGNARTQGITGNAITQ
jgi:hypothetical protein